MVWIKIDIMACRRILCALSFKLEKNARWERRLSYFCVRQKKKANIFLQTGFEIILQISTREIVLIPKSVLRLS